MINDDDELKRAMKEALKEWLDIQFLQFGKWSAKALAAIIFSGLIYLGLLSYGWVKK